VSPPYAMIIRPAVLEDLPQLTEIYNYYVVHAHTTFDVRAFTVEQRVGWFRDHSDGGRHRLVVAEEETGQIVGYAGTGPYRAKEAYETTVELTVHCRHGATGKGIGTQLYGALLPSLAGADVHCLVAGIAQPNPASNALHARFGFKPIGTFPEVGRKFGKYWDVVWLARMER
jgi:phosphinothricin acetyltransferase